MGLGGGGRCHPRAQLGVGKGFGRGEAQGLARDN